MSRKKNNSSSHESVIYAVGDIHGCVDQLQKLHSLIRADAKSRKGKDKLIIYLGDYIDRGIDSRGVIEVLLSEPLKGFTCHYLKGNHEDMFLRFMAGEAVAQPWLTYGGASTLHSYGVMPPRSHNVNSDINRVRAALLTALPLDHLNFFRQLKLSYATAQHIFVHAGLKPGRSLEEQNDTDMMWIRGEFIQSNHDFGRVVVHGHHITPGPDVCPHRIGIDTGAFATGHLTCLAIDGAKTSFINT
jgi:serine/threonine protein phosphatase 1